MSDAERNRLLDEIDHRLRLMEAERHGWPYSGDN